VRTPKPSNCAPCPRQKPASVPIRKCSIKTSVSTMKSADALGRMGSTMRQEAVNNRSSSLNNLFQQTGDTWLSDDCALSYTCEACNDCGDTFGDIVTFPHSCGEYQICNSGVCEDDPDPCRPSPCLNGGTCQSSGDQYECTCPENYIGQHCETECWYTTFLICIQLFLYFS
jgi:hypothetical protein